MSEHPELPYIAATAVAIGGATIRDGKIPDLTAPAIGAVGLILLASATAETRFAPLVRALGFLLLLSTVIAATNVVRTKAKAKAKK